MDLEAELERFEKLCAEHIGELERIYGADWDRTGGHGEHSEMSLELYEPHVAAEESSGLERRETVGIDHLAQIASSCDSIRQP